jgi:hypothetical protein
MTNANNSKYVNGAHYESNARDEDVESLPGGGWWGVKISILLSDLPYFAFLSSIE